MTEGTSQATASRIRERPAHRIRLPGFVSDKDIGLGDVVTRSTSFFGIKPCEGCKRRAAALNRWMVFYGGHSR